MKTNKYWRFLLLPIATLISFSFVNAQSALPRMPSGPVPKAPIGEIPIATPPTIGEIAAAIKMYHLGDYRGALALASELAQKGDANAMALAGFMNERGFGKAIDYEAAAGFYRRAALMNNDDAMIGLGRLANQNLGSVSKGEARIALEKALLAGRLDARILLANIIYFDEANQDKTPRF